jgi:hypothetical protein
MSPTSIIKKPKAGAGSRICLVIGGIWLIASCFLAAFPGGFWESYLISFVLSLSGLILAQSKSQRIAGVVLSGLSGAACGQDFLIFLK